MSAPVIPASTPTVVQPAPAPITYDHYWLTNLRIGAFDPSQPIRVNASLQKANTATDGTVTLSPVDQPVFIRIPDLMAAIAAAPSGDTSLSDAMTAVLTAIVKYAQSQNIVL